MQQVIHKFCFPSARIRHSPGRELREGSFYVYNYTLSLDGGLPRLKSTAREESFANGIKGQVFVTKASLQDEGYRVWFDLESVVILAQVMLCRNEYLLGFQPRYVEETG